MKGCSHSNQKAKSTKSNEVNVGSTLLNSLDSLDLIFIYSPETKRC